MTTPIAGDPELGKWHLVMQAALGKLRANPSDPVARQALTAGHTAIQNWVGRRASDNATTNQQELDQANDPGKLASTLQGFSQGATFGLGDELAGAVEAPFTRQHGESLSQSYARNRDANRAFDAQADAAHPGYHLAGDIGAGLIPLAASATGRLVSPAVSALRTALGEGGELGASLAQKIGSAVRGGLTGAGYAAARGYGSGEEGPIADLGSAAQAAPLGFGIGTVATGLGNAASRRSALGAAQETATAENAAKSRIEREVAEATKDARITAGNERGAQAPFRTIVSESRAQSAPDQVAITALRRANMEQAIGAPVQGQMGPNQADAEAAISRESARKAAADADYSRIEQLQRGPQPLVQGQMGPLQSTQTMTGPIGSVTGSGGIRLDTPEAQAAIARARAQTAAQGVVDRAAQTGRVASPVAEQVVQTDPADIARAAHAQVMAASGDAEAAKAAAREAAGRARSAIPEPTEPGSLEPDLDASLRLGRIVSQRPTTSGRSDLLDLLQTVSPEQQQSIARQLPTQWKLFLGIK